MTKPKSKKQLRGFIGLVSFYRNLFRGRAHYLDPLTELLIDKKRRTVQWTEKSEQAFEKIEKISAEDALLHLPDFNKSFVIYTDSSDYQIGANNSQEGRMIVYWSKNITNLETIFNNRARAPNI